MGFPLMVWFWVDFSVDFGLIGLSCVVMGFGGSGCVVLGYGGDCWVVLCYGFYETVRANKRERESIESMKD